jgi:hypothetical protein
MDNSNTRVLPATTSSSRSGSQVELKDGGVNDLKMVPCIGHQPVLTSAVDTEQAAGGASLLVRVLPPVHSIQQTVDVEQCCPVANIVEPNANPGTLNVMHIKNSLFCRNSESEAASEISSLSVEEAVDQARLPEMSSDGAYQIVSDSLSAGTKAPKQEPLSDSDRNIQQCDASAEDLIGIGVKEQVVNETSQATKRVCSDETDSDSKRRKLNSLES